MEKEVASIALSSLGQWLFFMRVTVHSLRGSDWSSTSNGSWGLWLSHLPPTPIPLGVTQSRGSQGAIWTHVCGHQQPSFQPGTELRPRYISLDYQPPQCFPAGSGRPQNDCRWVNHSLPARHVEDTLADIWNTSKHTRWLRQHFWKLEKKDKNAPTIHGYHVPSLIKLYVSAWTPRFA